MSIAAELHDKMPFVYSEDVLTSDVFSAFRYLPADFGIIGFLRSVEGLGYLIEPPDPASSCTVYFWPWSGRREPDVLLELSIRSRVYHVLIEAKYRSGASDSEDEMDEDGENIRVIGNQLAAEFEDLLRGFFRVRVGGSPSQELALASAPRDRMLLYLTAHQTAPQGELDKSAAYRPVPADRLFWASWYHVYEYLAGSDEFRCQSPYREIVDDLTALLRKKGFCPLLSLPKPPALRRSALPHFQWLG